MILVVTAEVLVDEEMPKIVILTDALSVLQSLETEDKNMNELLTALAALCEGRTVVLQWIPLHCGISGNEEADRLYIQQRADNYHQVNLQEKVG